MGQPRPLSTSTITVVGGPSDDAHTHTHSHAANLQLQFHLEVRDDLLQHVFVLAPAVLLLRVLEDLLHVLLARVLPYDLMQQPLAQRLVRRVVLGGLAGGAHELGAGDTLGGSHAAAAAAAAA
eukprot:CAMPEP_0197576692 /NCGR_PEP_ID=MMETSP1326-20131121/1616_1 /TAXON_ID=1155430 /ORGANISM="Genus nov. species nov., Strain RCC2288" /LENGTH=122 /DNA_ID=CAMNT_0043139649 /DNA_START=66 /DNA_END=431 /DNA_ORIENTATION=+